MRESVSHPHSRLFWIALLAVGSLTVLTGIAVLVALMNPESIRNVPTVALVCVLILLCVPAPVLLLERSDRKAAQRQIKLEHESTHPPREAVLHASHQSEASAHRTHRSHHERSVQRPTESTNTPAIS